MHGRIEVSIDIDDVTHTGIAGARAVRLAHKARVHGQEHIGILHREVAADRALGSPDGHVARMAVGDDAGNERCGDGYRIRQVQELEQLGTSLPRTSAGLDHDTLGISQCSGSPAIGVSVPGGARVRWGISGELVEAEARERGRLGIHREQEVEGPRPVQVIDGVQGPTQGRG